MVAISNCSAMYGDAMAWNESTLFTTAESCSMCQSAQSWSHIPRTVYGTSIASLVEYGIAQIMISSKDVAEHSKMLVNSTIVGGVLRDQTDALFRNNSVRIKIHDSRLHRH
eukprot:TRINITY_DN2790_c0_g1_i2.p1 TRINITY_DN2790_c0_g1~~TRINITY_DN2790_c0_g1_i2.p1  ORF type:complete len:111 (+),score=9.38 TRINITY_DN2790_c0_g1_i2:326-658(+)